MFDYAVVSVALSEELPEAWDQLLKQGLAWHDNASRADQAERLCRDLLTHIPGAISGPRDDFLTEDYVVFTILDQAREQPAEALLADSRHRHREVAAGGTRGPQRAGARRGAAPSHFLLPDRPGDPDLEQRTRLRPPAGRPGALELLEFVNSQLLEFRYYDQLLDAELARIYAPLQGVPGGRPG